MSSLLSRPLTRAYKHGAIASSAACPLNYAPSPHLSSRLPAFPAIPPKGTRKATYQRYFVTLAQMTVHHYPFPKIPRPNRRALYYSFGSVSIAGIRSFHHIRNGPKSGVVRGATQGAQFLVGTRKRLFQRRRFAHSPLGPNGSPVRTAAAAAAADTAATSKHFRSLLVVTFIAVFFFGVVARYEYNDYDEDGEYADPSDEAAEAAQASQRKHKKLPIRPTSVALYIYQRLPLNAISRMWGRLNRIELPTWLREPSFKFYASVFGVDLTEMADPELQHYHNLSEFFYRTLKPECRPIDPDAQLTSPCDGQVIKLGLVENGEIEQVKGMTYSVKALLGTSTSKKAGSVKTIEYPSGDGDDNDDSEIAQRFLAELEESKNPSSSSSESNPGSDSDSDTGTSGSRANRLVQYTKEGDESLFHPSSAEILDIISKLTPASPDPTHKLYYAVIYLSPGDYHHFHAPANWVATTRRHFAGELYSVAPFFQRSFNDLFVLNERVALLGYWRHGFFSMTPVGATNVGSIKVNFDKDLSTNVPYRYPETLNDGEKQTTKPKKIKKNTCYEATYKNASDTLKGQPLFKGDDMGGFMLGSTVVLCFEAPEDFNFVIHEGDHVKVGQRVGLFQHQTTATTNQPAKSD